MKNGIFKSVSLMLCLCMLLSVVPVINVAAVDYADRADDYYKVISKTDYELAPGIVESEIILNNDAGSHRQVAHVVEIDINNPYTKVMPSYKGMNQGLDNKEYGVQVMSQQAAYAEANGYGNVVAAMNLSLSWYNSAYYNEHAELVGEPLGYLVMNGQLYVNSVGQTSGAQTCLVINFDEKDGVARPNDIPKTEIRSTSSAITGWEEQVIPANFGFLVKDGVNQYKKDHSSDAASRSFVGIKADGSIVMVMNDGRQSPYSAGFNSYEMAEFMLSLGCVQAVNGDGGGSSTFLSQRPGEELELHCLPSDGAERPTTHGILVISTAPATGEFVRAQITTSDKFYTPGTAVQFDALGTDLVGTPAEIPADAVWQLTDDSFGTIDNAGLFTSNGKLGEVTAQLVYGGKVVGEATITIVIPEISFKMDTLVLPYGETSAISLNVTTNNGLNTVTTKPGDIVFTLSDAAMGSMDDNIFTTTSDTAVKGGTLTAVICGQTENAITATIKFGKASEIAYSYEDAYFPIDTSNTGNIGGDDAPDTGEYIYGWHISDTRQNGHFSYRYFAKKNYTPIGYDIESSVYLVNRDTGLVRNGDYAMGITIDWTRVTASCHGQMDVFLPEPLDLTDATRVGFWMYLPADMVTASMQLRAGFRTKTGGSTAVTASITDMLGKNSGVENGGWFYFSWEVLDTYQTFDYFQLNSHYTAGEGNYNYYQKITYYVDDITVDYSDATIDRENPYFTSMSAGEFDETSELKGQTFNSNTITLKAQAYENTAKLNATGLDLSSLKVYIDGVLYQGDVTISAGGSIAIADLYLNDGVHTIVMEISDAQGNTGNIARKVVIKSEKSAVRLEVPAANGLLPTGSLYWVNLVADNLAAIDSVTTTVTLDYVNAWELEGMEVAYGFTAEYYIDNHNNAVITFTRTEDEVADTTVLAKLPIRIWMAKGWMDDSGIRGTYISNDPGKQDKYYILTPHAMWYSDGTRDYRLVVGAEAGVATYTDGSVITFSANETVIQTEMNRYYTNANRQGKWSFHICTAGEAQSKDATCTEAGYTGRVFCVACACGSVENIGSECDTHNGCGSVLVWGETIPATGHNYVDMDGVLTCEGCGKLYNGEINGLLYADGVLANGWINDTYYCVNGAKVTGLKILDRIVRYFDENGVYDPTYSYSGLINWGSDLYYAINNKFVSGWQFVDGNYYYFSSSNQKAANGVKTTGGYTYRFEDFKLVEGQWVTSGENLKYMYAGRWCKNQWVTVNGVSYCFDGKAHAYIGVQKPTNHDKYYVFDETGAWLENYNGSYTWNGKNYFVIDGIAVNGLIEMNGYYYYVRSNGEFATGKYYTTTTNGLLPADFYVFGADGKMLNPPGTELKEGIHANENGVLCYYKGGIPTAAGLIYIDGYYYYARTGGILATGKYWTTNTNGLLEAKLYTFDTDGKMLNPNGEEIVGKTGIYEEDGVWYYYKNGERNAAGLIYIDGYYYYARTGGILATGKYWTTNHNNLLPAALYTFAADGKMLNPNGEEVEQGKTGVYEVDGVWYYYKNGEPFAAGLIYIDGYYYYARTGGILAIGKYWTTNHNGLMAAALYEFDAQGRMIIN